MDREQARKVADLDQNMAEIRDVSGPGMKAAYDSFVGAGFTDDQAMDLLKTIIAATIQKPQS